MKKRIVLSLSLMCVLCGAATPTEVKDTPAYYQFTAESPDQPIKLSLRPQNFPIRSGRQYWADSTYQYGAAFTAKVDGELDIEFPAVLRTAITVSPFPGNLAPAFGKDWTSEQKSGIMPVNGDRGIDGHFGNRLGDTLPNGIGHISMQNGQLLFRKSSNTGVLVVSTTKTFLLAPNTEYQLGGFHTPRKGGFGTALFIWAEVEQPEGKSRIYPLRNINPVIIDGKHRYVKTIFKTPAVTQNMPARLKVAMGGPAGEIVVDDLILQKCPPGFPQTGPEIDKDRQEVVISATKAESLLAARAVVQPVLKMIGGRIPQLQIDGQITPLFGFNHNPLVSDPRKSGARDFFENGVSLQWFIANMSLPDKRMKPLWHDFGKYDFEVLRNQLLTLVQCAPDAKVLLYLSCDPGSWFFRKYPQAAWLDRNGKVIPGQWRDTFAVSYCSPDYLREMGKAIYDLGRFLATDPAGKIVAGVHLTGGQDGQFFAQGNRIHWDHSVNFRNALRGYLREVYDNDSHKLATAWGDEKLTFDTVETPSESDRESSNPFLSPERPEDRRIIDVNRFWNLSAVRMLEHFARSFKDGIGRPALVSVYYNDIYGIPLGKSAAADLYRSPFIDGIVSCNSYGVERRPGASGGNGSSASIGLHGKFHLQELDYRTEYSFIRARGLDKNGIGATDGFEEHAAILQRDMSAALALGQGAWIFALSGNAWSHPGFMRAIREMSLAARDCAIRPMPEDHAQIGVFADERMDYYLGSRNNFGKVYRIHHTNGPRYALARSGMSCDYYLLSDLTHPKRPAYKINVFLSASAISDAEISYVEKNLQKDGNVLVFISDSGRVAPGGFENNIRRLTGLNIKMNPRKLVQQRYDPVLPKDSLFGDNPFTYSEGVGPEFEIGIMPGVQVLAYYSGTRKPAAVLKKHADWTAVYLALPGGVNPPLIRNLAKNAGLIPAGTVNNIVYSGNGVISLHAGSSGRKTLHWQEKCDLFDLVQRRIVASDVDSYTFDAQTGETRMFRRIPHE